MTQFVYCSGGFVNPEPPTRRVSVLLAHEIRHELLLLRLRRIVDGGSATLWVEVAR